MDTPGFGDAVDNTQRSVRNARRGGASPPFDARFPARQLEAAAGLRGAAVGSVLPRRERPGPPQHPRRPRALLPLLHLAVRPRVRGRPGGVEALPSQGPASIRVCVRACSLRPVDVECMRALHDKVNLLPLLAKADSLTPDELRKKKLKVGGARQVGGAEPFAAPNVPFLPARRSVRSCGASGSTSTASPTATRTRRTTTTTSSGGTDCSRLPSAPSGRPALERADGRRIVVVRVRACRTASPSPSSGATSWWRVEAAGSKVARTPGEPSKVAAHLSDPSVSQTRLFSGLCPTDKTRWPFRRAALTL